MWRYPSKLQTSKLSLSEEGILHQSKFVYEENKLLFHQGFGHNVSNLLLFGDIMDFDCSLLYPISDEVIFDLKMLSPVME
jgi:hypothetical protein